MASDSWWDSFLLWVFDLAKNLGFSDNLNFSKRKISWIPYFSTSRPSKSAQTSSWQEEASWNRHGEGGILHVHYKGLRTSRNVRCQAPSLRFCGSQVQRCNSQWEINQCDKFLHWTRPNLHSELPLVQYQASSTSRQGRCDPRRSRKVLRLLVQFPVLERVFVFGRGG